MEGILWASGHLSPSATTCLHDQTSPHAHGVSKQGLASSGRQALHFKLIVRQHGVIATSSADRVVTDQLLAQQSFLCTLFCISSCNRGSVFFGPPDLLTTSTCKLRNRA